MSDYIKRKHALRIAKDVEEGNVPVALLVGLIEAIPSAELPKGDLISRADAIRAVEQEYKVERGYLADDYTYGFNQAIQYISDIILQDLPSADAVQEWIPTENKLPKCHKDVIATVWFEDDGDDEDALEIAFGFRDKFGKWHLSLADGSECIKGFYVQAWQPLPKPYKGGNE